MRRADPLTELRALTALTAVTALMAWAMRLAQSGDGGKAWFGLHP